MEAPIAQHPTGLIPSAHIHTYFTIVYALTAPQLHIYPCTDSAHFHHQEWAESG